MASNQTHITLPAIGYSCPPGADDLFGPAVVGCRGGFDFTLFFEQTILSLAPSAALLLVFPFRLSRLFKSSIKTLPTPIHTAKSVTAFSFGALQLSLLVLWSSNYGTRTQASVPAAAINFIASLAIFVLSYVEHSRSIKPSFILNVYLLFSLVFDIAQARTLYLLHDDTPLASVFSATMGIKLALLFLESQGKRDYLRPSYRDLPPESTSGIFNQSTFWWLNSLFVRGARNLLSFNDLFDIDEELSSEQLGLRLQRAWDARSKPESRFSLLVAILKCLKWPMLSVIFPRLCLIGFSYAQPFLITSAIDYVSQPETNAVDANQGSGLIGATALIYLGIAMSTVHYKHRLYRCMTMFRGAATVLIYNRTLLIQDGVYDESAAVTLMSTDIDRITASLEDANEVWAQLLEVVLGVYLLARQLGWVSVMPLVVVGLCTVGSGRVANLIAGRQKVWAAAVQRRIGVTSTMLGNMKSVKMLGLSNFMRTTIQAQRLRELFLQKKFRWMIVWLNVFANIPSSMVPPITFATFAIQAAVRGSSSLNTTQAFTSLAILSLLTGPAAQLLAAVPVTASAMGCFDRIQNYMLAPSRKDERATIGRSTPVAGDARLASFPDDDGAMELQTLRRTSSGAFGLYAVFVDGADIRPAPTAELALKDVNIRVKSGSLTMVVGQVGSGKSTLLKAILGELPCEKGHIWVKSTRIAYCAQAPWMLNCNIRQSICGIAENTAVDEDWYQAVLNACVLNHDLEQLPDGDQSIVGSRGLTLSGGQKQRLAIARAIYARPDIVILDDVLSALDGRTEGLLVSRLLGPRGLLRTLDSTIILVTHATRHLPLSDEIIVLTQDGRIAQQGTYEALRKEEGFVSSILLNSPKSSGHDIGPADKKIAIKEAKGPSEEQVKDLSRQVGDLSVYKYYMKAIGWSKGGSFLAAVALTVFCLLFPQVWLKWWTDADGGQIGKYVVVYVLLGLGSVGFNVINIWSMLILIAPSAAAKLHYILLKSVVAAPLSFFAATDTGTTLNRFSQDMTLIESQLPIAVMVSANTLVGCLGQAALISTGTNYMAVTIPLVLGGVYLIQNIYLRTSRQLRYMDLEAKSPVYSHFLETLEGVSTIRAFGWQEQSSAINIQRLDASQRPYYLLFCIQRWLNLVLDLMVAALAIIMIAMAVSLRSATSGGLLGIALNNLLNFNQGISQFVTFWTQLETSLGAIARLKNFESQTPQEAKPGEVVEPPEEWPESGAIEFRNVVANYSPDAPALRGVSMAIQPGQKIGICGRTGSGKSSLLSTLLRILDIDSGSIIVDGLDLAVLPRETIRERMVAIPQEPFILAGSVRRNADPLGLASDALIEAALTKVHLWPTILARGGLAADLNAQPLSHGQQQLLCLARAMLRPARILILDEATSNVDKDTDALMQRVIREHFRTHTIVTVAHRLDTILDSDKVGVLDGGRLVEFDSPHALLARPSLFREQYNG